MKLHKVVEKAKSQRRQAAETRPEQAGQQSPEPAGASEGWVPPVYSEVRCVELDEQVLRNNRLTCYWPDTPELQHYKLLRAQINRRTRKMGWNTFMITSTRPGEGKSLTAVNLSFTFSKSYNQTVLLVDCDLRRQSIYRYLGIASDKGLVDHLAHDVPLKDIIIWPKVERLTLISGGRTIHESAELLESPRMKTLVAEMKQRYADRCILFDAPPLLSGADALTLASLVDGVIVVVESGKTTYKELEEGLSLLPREKVMGILLNKHASPNDSYYSYYGKT